MRKNYVEYQGDIRKTPNDLKNIMGYLMMLLTSYEQKIKEENSLEEFQEITNVVKDAFSRSLTTIDGLVSEKNLEENINVDYLITLLWHTFSKYAFEGNHGVNFSNKETAEILIECLNFIAKFHDYDRTFDLKDFVSKYQDLCREKEVEELKNFALKVNLYMNAIMCGQNPDSLLKNYFNELGIYRVSKSGTIYYNQEFRERTKISSRPMSDPEAQEILKEIDAIACAYHKSKDIVNRRMTPTQAPQIDAKNKLIYHRIKRMKTRGETRY